MADSLAVAAREGTMRLTAGLVTFWLKAAKG